MARTGVTSIDLEFDTGSKGSALLGDIASSLVSLDDLLRALASIAAYPSSAEFRKIEIVSIELRSPLKIKLSLFAIPPNALKAFQAICLDIIRFREHPSRQAPPAALVLRTLEGVDAQMTEQEAKRLSSHIVTLQNAEIPLKRIEVNEA
jgi:hypothetical protein